MALLLSSPASPPPSSPPPSSAALVPRRQAKARGTPSKVKTKAKVKAPKRPKLKWRTRDSQNSHLYNLQLDINDLHQEIQSLEQMRGILRAQTLNRMDDRDGSFMKVVLEYHRVFQFGYQPLAELSNGQVIDTMEFLSRVMDERVSIGRFVGLDMMRDQWARYSTAFTGLELRYISSEVLPQMDYIPPNGLARPVAMVTSKASYESLFTLETIAVMFPHLLQHKSVVKKLLGKKFRGIAHFDFVFDTNTHRVIGYDFRLDILQAFARLLHDPEDLCFLFEGAKISEESLIGDLNVYPQTNSSGANTLHDDVSARYMDLGHATVMSPRQQQLTNILDPAERAIPVPVQVPSVQVPSVPQSAPTRQPWQLQISNILTDAPDEEEEDEPNGELNPPETDEQMDPNIVGPQPRLPSMSSYFPASAFGKSAGSSGYAQLGKRPNPFGGELPRPW